MEVSTTQASNFTVIAGAIVTLLAVGPKIAHPSTLTKEDVVAILVSITALVASAVSFYNRYKKGDLHLSGVRKTSNSDEV